MLHGKHSQNLSVRELEAHARQPDAPQSSERETRSSRLLETPSEMRQRLEREENIRVRLEGSPLQQSRIRPTLGFGVRLIYFLTVGIWFGFVWLALGVAFCLSLIGLPLGILMLRHIDKAFALW